MTAQPRGCAAYEGFCQTFADRVTANPVFVPFGPLILLDYACWHRFCLFLPPKL